MRDRKRQREREREESKIRDGKREINDKMIPHACIQIIKSRRG